MRKTNGNTKTVFLNAGEDGVYSTMQSSVSDDVKAAFNKADDGGFLKTPKSDSFDDFVHDFEEKSRRSEAQFDKEWQQANEAMHDAFKGFNSYVPPRPVVRERPLLKAVANTMCVVGVILVVAAVVAHYNDNH